MNREFLSGIFRPGLRAACLMFAAAVATPAMAATNIAVWHALPGHHAEKLNSLAQSFNRSQSDYKVSLKSFDTPEALEIALVQGYQSGSMPAMAELGDTHTLEEIAARPYVQPFYTLQKSAALKSIDWFVPKESAFIHDEKGRLMAFPYMLEIPVMYYNLDAFQKAGLEPAAPKRVWIELQNQLVELANNGSRKCPLTSDLPVSINLENLAAVNNQLYASAENGLKAKGLPSFSFNATYVRHLSLMIAWVRSEIMVRPDAGMHSVERFAQGECAVMFSSSEHIGTFNANKNLNYSISGLPYYPEVTKEPGNPFISGSALWVMKSDKPVIEGTEQFLAWLAQPEQAAKWYQDTGYLPLIRQAFDQTPASYYDHMGQWRDLVAVYSQPAALTAQGFRIRNYPAIHTRFQEIINRALDGDQPAVTALNAAASEANRLLQEK